MRMEILSVPQILESWHKIKPMLDSSCQSNPIIADEIDAEQILELVRSGLAMVLGFYDEDDDLALVLVFRFYEVNGRKIADILAMAGRSLMKFKAAYRDMILDWLRANGVEFLDTCASERLANIYMKKFGFSKSCMYVRMNLQGARYEQRS